MPGQVVEEHPYLNALLPGDRLITLDEVTVSLMVEREVSGEIVLETLWSGMGLGSRELLHIEPQKVLT